MQLQHNSHAHIVKNTQRSFTSTEVTLLYLREIFSRIRKVTRESIREAVFTVPVDSFETYRYHLKNITSRLGVSKIRMIDEPVAAAIGYGINLSGKKNVLVFDFGGGTLDLALVTIDGQSLETGSCRVVAKEGLNLGGNVVDTWILNDFFARTGYDLSDQLNNTMISIWYRILKAEICRVKESLYVHEKEKVIVNPPDYYRSLTRILDGDLEKLETYTRDDLVRILETNHFYDLLHQIVQNTLAKGKAGGIEPDDIDDVLVIGGSSLLPGVFKLLEEYFGRGRIRAWKPFEAIAYGGAVYAAGRMIQHDTITHSYAILTYDKKTHEPEYHIIVPEGTRYPTKERLWRRQLVPTCSHGEPETVFKLVICEVGSRRNGQDFYWDELGRLKVVNSTTQNPVIIKLNADDPALGYLNPPHSPGERGPRLDISFSVDENRWLCASVYDMKTQKYLMNEEPVIRLI
jgi:molecular chaperone DnaK (HSP70)